MREKAPLIYFSMLRAFSFKRAKRRIYIIFGWPIMFCVQFTVTYRVCVCVCVCELVSCLYFDRLAEQTHSVFAYMSINTFMQPANPEYLSK